MPLLFATMGNIWEGALKIVSENIPFLLQPSLQEKSRRTPRL